VANTTLNSSILTKESLRILENNLVFAKAAKRNYSSKFAVAGAKVDDQIEVRQPVRFTVSTGESMDLQNVEEKKIAIVLDKRKHVAFSFSTQELTLTIDQFSERYLKTAMATIANQIDFDGLQEYKSVANEVGTPGTVPSSLLTYLQAGQKMNEEAAPLDGQRSVCITPAMQATIVNALTGLFHDTTEVAKQYKEGTMGRAAGLKFSMDQNVATHTKGTFTTGSTPLTNGAGTEGASTLVTDGWAASTLVLTRGDVFTIAAVNAVNPQSRQSTGALRQFVVTDDATSDGSGDLTISISPSIFASGPYQNVDALPADGAAITPRGTEAASNPVALAVHPDGRDGRSALQAGCALRVEDPVSGTDVPSGQLREQNQSHETLFGG
jgi:hypothetical protein